MARYLLKNKVLVQHIPRCGGSWVEKAIDLCKIKRIGWLAKQPQWICQKHALLSHYQREQLAGVNYVVVFVRHPLDYYLSTWKWLRKGHSLRKRGYTWHPHFTADRVLRRYPQFDSWVKGMLDQYPLWYTRLIEQYVGPRGGEFCDWIGRTESLADDFVGAMRAVGYVREVEAKLPALRDLRRLNNIDREIEWDQSLRQEVLSSESEVIERFYASSTTSKRLYAQLAAQGIEAVAH